MCISRGSNFLTFGARALSTLGMLPRLELAFLQPLLVTPLGLCALVTARPRPQFFTASVGRDRFDLVRLERFEDLPIGRAYRALPP